MSAPNERCRKCGDSVRGHYHASEQYGDGCGYACHRTSGDCIYGEHGAFRCECGFSWGRAWKRSDAHKKRRGRAAEKPEGER